jgi:membrane fusion protein (multidrug efflux system)
VVLEQVIVVPRRALLSGPEGPYVWVVDRENKVQSRPIRVGRASLNEVVASEGVTAGDRVIVEGVLKVHPGVTVAATETPDGKAATQGAAPGGPAT